MHRRRGTWGFKPCAIAILGMALLLHSVEAGAQDELDALRRNGSRGATWLHFADAGQWLYDHLAMQGYGFLEEREERIDKIRALPEWKERQEEVREKLGDLFGPFPEKTPLNGKVLRVIKKEGFRVEHLVYESLPGYYVTASLFLPQQVNRRKKAPAVLFCSGHTDIAYRSRKEHYQPLILNLVHKGFVVLAFDPVGQGERLQYFDAKTGESLIGNSTGEHSYSGIQAFISGRSQAWYMTWDGIRGVDYLLSRKEVDPDRIGITGCSGGGTQTTYIAAFDERIKASVPSCYITSFKRLLQSIGPQDAEQNLHRGISEGIDHADFLTVRAPKPVMIMSTTEDFFSIQGARETASEVLRIYQAFGSGDNFAMAEDAGGHGTTRKNREAMYAFFQKHLDNPGDPAEEELELLTDEEMRITPTGQLSTSLGGETIFSLNSRYSGQLLDRLDHARQDPSTHIPLAVESARKISGYHEPSRSSDPVFTGQIIRDGYVIEKYFVRGEGDYVIPYLLVIPDRPGNKALIYLHPSGKNQEAREGGEIEWFVRKGFTVLVPDLVGTGETGGGRPGRDYVWFASVLMGRSITGIRAGDVSTLAEILKEQHGFKEIYGVARKEMSAVLLHAAAFDPSIGPIALLEPLSSYGSVVMNRFYDLAHVESTVAGALQAYDLPDLAAALAPRKLLITGMTDGQGEPLRNEEEVRDLEVVRAAYRLKPGDLKVDPASGFPAGLLSDWIR